MNLKTSPMKGPNEKAIKTFFEKNLLRSGHSLELAVAKSLSGYNVKQEVPYIDKDKSIGRFSDLVATRQIPPLDAFENKSIDGKRVVGQVVLIIECKNLPDHGWILWESKPPDLLFVDNANLSDNVSTNLFKGDPAYRYMPLAAIPQLFCASSFEEYIVDIGRTKRESRSNPTTKNMLDAVMKVTKATEYHVQKMRDVLSHEMVATASKLENFILFSFIQPLIIFEGYLYGAKDEPNVGLQKIKFAQLYKQYVSEKYNVTRGMIHVVSYKALPEYLNLFESYYMHGARKMVNDQEELMDKVFLMVDYLAKCLNLHQGFCRGRFQELLEYTQGKPLETKLSEVKLPHVYIKNKINGKAQKVEYGENKYDREIHYCLNCGTSVTDMAKLNELACCPFFKRAVSTKSIEVIIYSSGYNLHKFLLNLLPRKSYIQEVNQGEEQDIDEIAVRWCPYCSIKIPEVS